MKKVIFSIIIFFAIISCLVLFVFMNESKRWMLFYGDSAEKYALALLKQKKTKPPDKFIDYSVSASNGHVIFSEHGSDTLYGYFSEKQPLDYKDDFKGEKWMLLEGKWFVYINKHPK